MLMLKLDPKALQDLCGAWQKILNLSHWDVVIEYSTHEEMIDSNGNARPGVVSFVKDYMQAVISILEPEGWTDKRFSYDLEAIIVHELLHLHFADFKLPEIGNNDTAEERAIKYITKALLYKGRLLERE